MSTFHGYRKTRSGTLVRFHTEAVKDELASAERGRPIFKDEERVQISFPGNPWFKPVFPISQKHKDDWPDEYKSFKEGLEPSLVGTPLEEWPILTTARVLEMKALGFFTVENVAEASDVNLQRIGMGYFGLRDRAKAFLDDAENIALNERQAAENEKLTLELSNQTRQIAELRSLVDRLHGAQMAQANTLNPIAGAVPYMADPLAFAQQHQVATPTQASSLDGIAPRRRPGRPPKVDESAAA